MRVKGGTTARKYRKSIKKAASGARGTKHTSYRIASQTVIRSAQYAFRDRRAKKRDFRKLWIARISAAVKAEGYNYSQFMNGLKKNKVEINRKMLAELAINNPNEFKALVKEVCKK